MSVAGGFTHAEGVEERQREEVMRKGWFFFFPVTWWETVKETHIGNDICIVSNRPIRRVYLNGELVHERV